MKAAFFLGMAVLLLGSLILVSSVVASSIPPQNETPTGMAACVLSSHLRDVEPHDLNEWLNKRAVTYACMDFVAELERDR